MRNKSPITKHLRTKNIYQGKYYKKKVKSLHKNVKKSSNERNRM